MNRKAIITALLAIVAIGLISCRQSATKGANETGKR
jgi:hypothetical protein